MLCATVTAARVKEHLQAIVKGTVTRYELPNISSLLFVQQCIIRRRYYFACNGHTWKIYQFCFARNGNMTIAGLLQCSKIFCCMMCCSSSVRSRIVSPRAGATKLPAAIKDVPGPCKLFFLDNFTPMHLTEAACSFARLPAAATHCHRRKDEVKCTGDAE